MERKDQLMGSNLVDTNAITSQLPLLSTDQHVFAQPFGAASPPLLRAALITTPHEA
jgi:hypothetical protein